jgi:hypothetical protein
LFFYYIFCHKHDIFKPQKHEIYLLFFFVHLFFFISLIMISVQEIFKLPTNSQTLYYRTSVIYLRIKFVLDKIKLKTNPLFCKRKKCNTQLHLVFFKRRWSELIFYPFFYIVNILKEEYHKWSPNTSTTLEHFRVKIYFGTS